MRENECKSKVHVYLNVFVDEEIISLKNEIEHGMQEKQAYFMIASDVQSKHILL